MDYSSVEKVASVYQWAMEKQAINTAGYLRLKSAPKAVEAVGEAAGGASKFLRSRLTGKPVAAPRISQLEPSGMVGGGRIQERLGSPGRFAKPGVS